MTLPNAGISALWHPSGRLEAQEWQYGSVLPPHGGHKLVIVAFMRPQPRLSLVKGERQIRYDVTSAIQIRRMHAPLMVVDAGKRLFVYVKPPAAPGGTAVPGPRPGMMQASEARLGKEI